MILKNNDGKLNFLVGIHTPFSMALTGGVVAMHQLAYKIAERGHNVYTSTIIIKIILSRYL